MEKSKAIFMGLPRTKEQILDANNKLVTTDLVARGAVERVARPFIAKKIKEYLGVEEEAMIKLVINHISSDESCTADSLFSKVEPILDDVTEQFVQKLWQVLLFEQAKIEEGVYDLQDKANQLKQLLG